MDDVFEKLPAQLACTLHIPTADLQQESANRLRKMMPPFSFSTWLAENKDQLKPPVNNHCLYTGDDFTLMVVGGPNKRNDFHGLFLATGGSVWERIAN